MIKAIFFDVDGTVFFDNPITGVDEDGIARALEHFGLL